MTEMCITKYFVVTPMMQLNTVQYYTNNEVQHQAKLSLLV